jgi:bifunctional enzyme CysN/CysC
VIVPISARDGDNIATRSPHMPWYDGPTVLSALDGFHGHPGLGAQPLRLPIQDVYKFDARRILAGRIESGVISVGDTVLFSPSNKTALVRSIEAWPENRKPDSAAAGEPVGIVLDEQLFVERGEIVSHVENPPKLSTLFHARLFWLGHKPLKVGSRYKLKLLTQEAEVTVQSIERIVDTQTLENSVGETVERNAVAEITLRSRQVLGLDDYGDLPKTGRFVLIEDYDTVGGGVISMEGLPDQRQTIEVKSTNVVSVEHRLTADTRASRNGHRGGVLWFTGLSGAGKSTLAMEVEQRLFAKGYQVYVLDGDNVRRGLNANLGFSPEDRTENIRRVGEAAALFADSGVICITAFISPYRVDRDRARASAPGRFHESYIEADVETCEGRDPKGLYKKARAGEIAQFTGVSAPYEAPEAADLVVDTSTRSVAESVESIIRYVEKAFTLTKDKGAAADR